MEILEILAFIALIAVIFGVSMHDAFMGILAFIGVAFLAAILIFLIKIKASEVADKRAFMKTAQGQAIKKMKAEKRKQSLISNLLGTLLVLCLLSPLLMMALMYLLFKDFAEANPLPTFIITITPLVTAVVVLFTMMRNRAKKRTNSK